MPGKIIATTYKTVQIGPEDWKIDHISRVFSTTCPIKDVFKWAESIGIEKPVPSDITYSEYTGESL